MLEIKIGGNSIIYPQDLSKLLNKIAKILPAEGNEPIIINGRLPVWVFSALTYWFYHRPWIATYEPREIKGVVVGSRIADVSIGDLIEIKEIKKIYVEYP
jgi:CRISPR-associated Csx3 family protein